MSRNTEKFITDYDGDVTSGGWERPMNDYQINKPYNFTQGEFSKLMTVLDNMTQKTYRQLDKPTAGYILKPETSDPELIYELDKITAVVLNEFNRKFSGDILNDSGQRYISKFTKTDYDNIKIWHDAKNNLHLIYDIFVQDIQRYPHAIRLKADVIKMNSLPHIMTENNRIVKYLQGRNHTDLGLASYSLNQDVLDIDGHEPLPPPTSAQSTPHYPVLDTINWTPPKELKRTLCEIGKDMIINKVRFFNSSLIIHPDKFVPRVPGSTNDNKLEYSCYMNARTYRAEPNVIRNKWIPLPDEPKDLKQFPCVPVSKCWDKWGVKHRMQPDAKCCNGLRHSTVQAPLQAEFNPTIHTNPRNEGLYSWLFDLWNESGETTSPTY